MKRIFLAPFFFLFLFVQVSFSQSNLSSKFIKPLNVNYVNSVRMTDSVDCDLEYIRFVKDGKITWEFEIFDEGWYALQFKYRSLKGEIVATLKTENYARSVGFGFSEKWNIFSTNTFLKAGRNKISIIEDWGSLDINSLIIEKVKLTPSIKPISNIFYKSFPEDLILKVNLYGTKIDFIKLSDSQIKYEISEYPLQENSIQLIMDKSNFINIPNGSYNIKIYFSSGEVKDFRLNIFNKPAESDIQIIIPHIDHGASVLIKLPDEKVMLIDCAKAWARDSILIPLLHSQNIDTINYFILTHYHEDHDSDDKGEKIKNLFNVQNFYDYKNISSGDEFSIGETHFKILNSYNDGIDENTHSLSIKMEYKGFVYVHGGDTYAMNQEKIMKNFPNDIEADVFHANHHFHGSVNVNYLRAMNPYLVVLQAQEAIYARSAYTDDFQKKTITYLKENNKHFIEELPTFEVGNIILRINDKNNWTYETHGKIIK